MQSIAGYSRHYSAMHFGMVYHNLSIRKYLKSFYSTDLFDTTKTSSQSMHLTLSSFVALKDFLHDRQIYFRVEDLTDLSSSTSTPFVDESELLTLFRNKLKSDILMVLINFNVSGLSYVSLYPYFFVNSTFNPCFSAASLNRRL